MKIIFFDKLPSTQQYLISNLKNRELKPPFCFATHYQTKGIGSRGNSWSSVDRGLYFSFCIDIIKLCDDINKQSLSIYFGYLFKEVLAHRGSNAWLKWPNDIYLGDRKICGILCNILNDVVVCGIGLNIDSRDYCNVESFIQADKSLLEDFFASFELKGWKYVFENYKNEFYKNKSFTFHNGDDVLSFQDAILLYDGSIKIGKEVFFSSR